MLPHRLMFLGGWRFLAGACSACAAGFALVSSRDDPAGDGCADVSVSRSSSPSIFFRRIGWVVDFLDCVHQLGVARRRQHVE